MKMFDFKGYGGTPAAVPLEKVNGLTRDPVMKGCFLWIEGSETPFMVTEHFDEIRQRLGDARPDNEIVVSGDGR